MNSSRIPLRSVLAIAIMALVFVLVLADRTKLWPQSAPFALALYEWAILLGGVALLLGVVNVLWVHWRRIQHGEGEWWLSLVLVVTLLAILLAGTVNTAGDRSPLLEWSFDSIIAPGYAALFALMIFFLGAAIYHRVRVGRPGGGWVLAGVLLMVLAQTPAAQTLLAPAWSSTIAWVANGPVTATVRGALLGVGLALIVVAVRALTGRRAL